jgi:hypothetical protein
MSGEAGHCRSCGAEVLWGVTPQDKRVPLDAKSEKRMIFVPDTGPTKERAIVVDTYTSHFATGPDAATWRRRS